jgi:hypothetical protein
MSAKNPLGLSKLSKVAQMPKAQRYEFLAEGLGVISRSAESYANAANLLKDFPREADVLEGFANEEAAKALILLDMFRCPKSQQTKTFQECVKAFYLHMARLLYADSVSWKPMHKGQLREYLDRHRHSHMIEGEYGEYVIPTGPVYDRELRLYADVEETEDEKLVWNAPGDWSEYRRDIPTLSVAPRAVNLILAMRRCGLFSSKGLMLLENAWQDKPVCDALDWGEAREISFQLLVEIQSNGLMKKDASEDDASVILDEWPMPMWDFAFSPIKVSLEDLREQQEVILANLYT